MEFMNRLVAFCLALVLAASPASAALTQIGAAGAVAGKVVALAREQGAVGRIMSSGKEVFLYDKVSTDASGRMQVMLLDETVFTIGPSSALIIDEFVYDPASRAGKVTAKVTQGVFRFITGKVANNQPSNMKVKLPVGTIGIRGTQALGKADESSSTVALLGPGKDTNSDERVGSISVENAGVTKTLLRAGWAVNIAGPDKPPSDPFPMPPQQLLELTHALSPKAEAGPDKGGKPATTESGQDAASARGDLLTIAAQSIAGTARSILLTNAANDAVGIPDGNSTFDQIRTLTTGTGFYFNDSAPITCTGCTSSNPISSLQVYYDFQNQFFGGGSSFTGPSGLNGSFIHLHGVYSSNNSDRIQSNINQINYGSLSGTASLNITSSLVPVGSSGSVGNQPGDAFTNVTLTLQNAGGVVAKNAVATFQFQNTSFGKSASGTNTAPR